MRKTLLSIMLLVFSSLVLKSQHCPFDAEGILVVRVHSIQDSSVIKNLRITLLDSLGNTVITPDWDFGKFLDDTLKFWQNPVVTTFHTTIDCNHPADPTRINFPFAKDNYVLMCPIFTKIGKYKLNIEDIDGTANDGKFAAVIYQLSEDDLYSLCGTYNRKIYPEDEDEVRKKFMPIDIQLSLE
jgi:hypothetical protein